MRLLTRQSVFYLLNFEDETLQAGRILGNHVCSLDGRVEIQFALWNVAKCALVVADLGPAGMIGAGGEIHIVVAGSASYAGRLGQISRGLRGAGIRLVAHFAAARVGGKHDGREVSYTPLKADDLIGVACLDAG